MILLEYYLFRVHANDSRQFIWPKSMEFDRLFMKKCSSDANKRIISHRGKLRTKKFFLRIIYKLCLLGILAVAFIAT